MSAPLEGLAASIPRATPANKRPTKLDLSTKRPRPSQVLPHPALSAALPLIASALAVLSLAIFAGGAFDPRLDLLASAAPFLLGTGLAVSALARLTGARRIALGALLAVALPALPIGVDLFLSVHARAPEFAPRLKVLSLNMYSYNFDLDAIERLIAEERPQVVLLQEANYGGLLLSERLITQFPNQIANYRHCSTRILSTLRLVRAFHSEDCAVTSARLAMPSPDGDREFVIASVHLPRSGFTGGQAWALRVQMGEWDGESAIVGGDFNRTPWSWALRRFDGIKHFQRRTRALPTWPTARAWPRAKRFAFPFMPIDHVYATSDWTTESVRRGPDVGSDHYPIIVELAGRSQERLEPSPNASGADRRR